MRWRRPGVLKVLWCRRCCGAEGAVVQKVLWCRRCCGAGLTCCAPQPPSTFSTAPQHPCTPAPQHVSETRLFLGVEALDHFLGEIEARVHVGEAGLRGEDHVEALFLR